MKAEGKITKAEGLLLGLTALFLCGLLVLARQDRLAAQSAPLAAEPEYAAILTQLCKSVLNRGGIVGDPVPLRAEIANVEYRPAGEESRGDHKKESQQRFHNAVASRGLS